MKKTFKAVIAMVLVLALGFAVLSTTAYAATAAGDVAAPRSADIRDFFSSMFKKISDAFQSLIDKIVKPTPTPTPDPEPVEPTNPAPVEPTTPVNPPAVNDDKIIIDNDQYSGSGVGGGDQYAGGIW